MPRIHFDSTQVRELVIDLREAPKRVQAKVPRTLRERVGPKLAREMKIDATGHMGNYFGRPGTEFVTDLPRHVSFEMDGKWEVEAGIEAKGAGLLGKIIAEGSVNNAPAYDVGAALRRSTPFALEWLADAAEQSVFGGGGE